mmetsp:Transcript_104596/g.326212  ORF Transcript_104596/g.326212 Transcript_104596/m.326212 type:complete len:309 (-) Transcript_104596:64-990(-)
MLFEVLTAGLLLRLCHMGSCSASSALPEEEAIAGLGRADPGHCDGAVDGTGACPSGDGRHRGAPVPLVTTPEEIEESRSVGCGELEVLDFSEGGGSASELLQARRHFEKPFLIRNYLPDEVFRAGQEYDRVDNTMERYGWAQQHVFQQGINVSHTWRSWPDYTRARFVELGPEVSQRGPAAEYMARRDFQHWLGNSPGGIMSIGRVGWGTIAHVHQAVWAYATLGDKLWFLLPAEAARPNAELSPGVAEDWKPPSAWPEMPQPCSASAFKAHTPHPFAVWRGLTPCCSSRARTTTRRVVWIRLPSASH